MFWIISLNLALFGNLVSVRQVWCNNTITDQEKINLEIEDTFDLGNETFKEYSRTFELSQKQDIYLLHIKCQSTENTIKKVIVHVNINEITTKAIFWDSNHDYSAPHSFNAGTTLTLRLNKSSPIYYLQNSLKLSLQVEMTTFAQISDTHFILDEVTLQTLTPPILTPETVGGVLLPLEVSQGEWYISPFSVLSERSLSTPLFAYFTVPLFIRITVEFNSSSLPLTFVSLSICSGQELLQKNSNVRNMLSNEILLGIEDKKELTLEIRFRPSTEIYNNIISFSIHVTASVVPSITDEKRIHPSLAYDFVPIHLNILELLRVTSLVIPLSLFYKRKRIGITEDLPITVIKNSGED